MGNWGKNTLIWSSPTAFLKPNIQTLIFLVQELITNRMFKYINVFYTFKI